MPIAIKNSLLNQKNTETNRQQAVLPMHASSLSVPRLMCLMYMFMLLFFSCTANAESLQVLHWWKSASERKAVEFLQEKLDYESVSWRDAVVPSGSGVGASIVLRSRILAGNAPEVAQLNGVLISEWDSLGLLLDVDTVAAGAKWEQSLLPTVLTLVQPHGHFVAAPLGIHRINTLFYNRKLFKQHGLAVPQTWLEFERLALKLQSLGIAALAQSSEPWQVASLFETLVLAEGGTDFYRDLFVFRKPGAFADLRLTRALQHLRDLKKWMAKPIQERTWIEVSRQLVDGEAAMMVMGDWAKAELNLWGQLGDDSMACAAVPATANFHLYDIDTFAMLATPKSARTAQEKLAKLTMSSAVQAEYNQIKGSVSVLRNPDMTKMDSCARASWKLFASGVAAQVPSLAHRMATDEITKDAMIAEIHQYFLDDKVSTMETQRRLATIARTVTRPVTRPIARKK